MDKNKVDYEKFLDLYSKNVIASTTDLKGIITYVSDAFCEISGYSKEELIGKAHNIIRHSDMPSSIYKELWDTIQSGKTYVGEIKNLKKSGGFYWVEVIISPEFDESGAVVGYGAIRHDITSRKENESLTKENKKLLNLFSKYVIASKANLAGIITYVSDAFSDISGYRRDELMGKPHNILRHSDMPQSLFKELWKTIQAGEVYFCEIKNRKKNGDHYWVEVAVSPEYNDDGKITGYSAIRHNITQKKIIEELMMTDFLTKIKNRQYYNSCIEKELEIVKRYNHKISLMLLDIDFFKQVNDKYGHDVGDNVLVEFSRLIEKSIRISDIFCRIGGEEFTIISTNNSYEENQKFANKILKIVENHNFGTIGKMTISIGMANFLKDDTKSSIFKRADQALYKSKNNGKNQITVKEG